MATADLSAITYFAPIAAFLLVFIVSAAILTTKKLLGENKFVNLFVSLLIASVFVSSVGTTNVLLTAIPWFALLVISLFCVMFLLGFAGSNDHTKKIALIVLILSGLIFLISSFFVFSEILYGYLPGPGFGSSGDPALLFYLDWIYSPRVVGAILLISLSAVVSWLLVKGGVVPAPGKK